MKLVLSVFVGIFIIAIASNVCNWREPDSKSIPPATFTTPMPTEQAIQPTVTPVSTSTVTVAVQKAIPTVAQTRPVRKLRTLRDLVLCDSLRLKRPWDWAVSPAAYWSMDPRLSVNWKRVTIYRSLPLKPAKTG